MRLPKIQLRIEARPRRPHAHEQHLERARQAVAREASRPRLF